MIKCPTTNGMSWTGLATARPTLNHIDSAPVFTSNCPVCKQQHKWTMADAWLDDDEAE
jgi:hypothetical protein